MRRSDPDNRSTQRIWYGGGVIKPPFALIEDCRRSDRRRCSDAAASNDTCNAPLIVPCCQDAIWREDEYGSTRVRQVANIGACDHRCAPQNGCRKAM